MADHDFGEIVSQHYNAVVVGSGFGAAVAAMALVEAAKGRPEFKLLIVERGTWWGNPEGPAVRATGSQHAPWDDTINGVTQSKQWWPRPNNHRGATYVYDSLYQTDDATSNAAGRDLGPAPNARGLFRYTRFEGEKGNVDIVSGSGVGGGSLFYSGVNLKPEDEVLERIGLELRDDDFERAGLWMKTHRGRINKIVTKVPVPHQKGTSTQLPWHDTSTRSPYEMPDPQLVDEEEDYLLIDRSRVLKRAYTAAQTELNNLGYATKPWKPLPLSVVEYDDAPGGDSNRKNAFCLRQGRCMLGCLPSARHTLYKTLSTKVDWKQVFLLPQTEVRFLTRRNPTGYNLAIRSRFADGEHQVTADKVFLGAGVLGSVEIMLRSQKRGLPVSSRTGAGFTTNGDFFAFAIGVNAETVTGRDPNGTEIKIGKVNPTDGPINASGFHLVYAEGTDARVDLHFEDCGIPATFAEFVQETLRSIDSYPKLFQLMVAAHTRMTAFNRGPLYKASGARPDPETRHQGSRENLGDPLDPLGLAGRPGYQTEQDMLADVFFFHAMGAAPNEPKGTFSLDSSDNGMTLDFDRDLRTEHEAFRRINEVATTLARRMGVDASSGYRPSPMWLHEHRMTVVHPLGGCCIGQSGHDGAVDEYGRVFDAIAADPKAVLPGLYVVDASVIPGSLAVNPTFTIVAQAIKTVDNAMTE